MNENIIKKQRIVVNKPMEKTCDICGKSCSLYSFSSHIKHIHKLTSDEYALKYGDFRQPKRSPTTRNIKQLICQLCNINIPSVGMFTHLRDTHKMTADAYSKQYGEYRPSKIRQLEYGERLKITSEENKEICVICKMEFASPNLLGFHIRNEHAITKKDYILKHIFNGIKPLCKCGCQGKVRTMSYYPYKMDYISGHNSDGYNNSMYGKHHTLESKKKMSIKAIERINRGIGKTTDTEPELKFKAILDKFGIEYVHPYSVDLGMRIASEDFYIKDIDLLVEIDGEYWHPSKIENMNLRLLPNVISDMQRIGIDNMIHIRSLELDKYEQLTSKEEVYNYLLKNGIRNNSNELGYKQVIISKEYFEYCLKEKGNSYLKDNIWLLLKFIRAFQVELPRPELEENLEEVIDKINKTDIGRIYDEETKEFSNNISTVGHNYLKHYFGSYWKSKFSGNLSPVEAWLDDKVMKEVIEYRIGCNNSGEVYDFSLHQLVRGLSARRVTVSFFKPLLAFAIYLTYIGEKKSPVVLDPCCGFGGRLLGFKSAYPSGKYIGCEPNIETYNELLGLVNRAGWKDVEIYNCKFEDFEDKNEYDLIFTSIPYYDIEIYSNNIGYKSFEEWRGTFIKAIERYNGKNCYINIPEELRKKLGWENIVSRISSNRSHFDKKNGQKKEAIVKI